MITIVSALKSELAPLLQRVQVTRKKNLAGGSLYISDRLHFLRTGVGPKNVLEVCTLYLDQFKPEQILNIGLAGKLDLTLSIGQIFSIRILKAEGKKPLIPIAVKAVPGVSLFTVEKAVTNAADRNHLYLLKGADIVDMEAYFIAEICAEKKVPFSCFKIISDEADKNTERVFPENYKRLSKELGDFIWKNKLKVFSGEK